jgi:peptide/nickel transport system permease protein
MLSYAIRRILLTIPTLIAVAVLVFFVLRVVPGDIVEIKLTAEGGMVSEEEIMREKERLGLNDPIMVQFYKYMIGLPQGDLGISLWTENNVSSEIAARIGLSFELAVLSTVLAVLIAFPLGDVISVIQRLDIRLCHTIINDWRDSCALILAWYANHYDVAGNRWPITAAWYRWII